MEDLQIVFWIAISIFIIYGGVRLIEFICNFRPIDGHKEINDYMKAKYGDDWINFGKEK